jgi:hypothetical protein
VIDLVFASTSAGEPVTNAHRSEGLDDAATKAVRKVELGQRRIGRKVLMMPQQRVGRKAVRKVGGKVVRQVERKVAAVDP